MAKKLKKTYNNQRKRDKFSAVLQIFPFAGRYVQGKKRYENNHQYQENGFNPYEVPTMIANQMSLTHWVIPPKNSWSFK